MQQQLTLVIPVYNEAQGITQALDQIAGILDGIADVQWRFLVVDDGSSDDTPRRLAAYRHQGKPIEYLCFTRNFGKESAMEAGLRHALENPATAAVIVMDADLQHPPELVPRMIELWRQGLPVIEAYKTHRGTESRLKRALVGLYFWLFELLSGVDIHNATDFKLLDRQVVEQFLALPESRRFFRGLVTWLGFPSARLPFAVPKREGGASHWNGLRLLRYSLDTLTAFSTLPLHLISVLGVLTLLVGVLIGGISLYQKWAGVAIGGFTTVILLLLMIGGAIMLSLGILGLYLARIYDEVKRRPNYILAPTMRNHPAQDHHHEL